MLAVLVRDLKGCRGKVGAVTLTLPPGLVSEWQGRKFVLVSPRAIESGSTYGGMSVVTVYGMTPATSIQVGSQELMATKPVFFPSGHIDLSADGELQKLQIMHYGHDAGEFALVPA